MYSPKQDTDINYEPVLKTRLIKMLLNDIEEAR